MSAWRSRKWRRRLAAWRGGVGVALAWLGKWRSAALGARSARRRGWRRLCGVALVVAAA